MAARLKIQAFPRRIRANEDADGLLVERRVEGDLDAVALFQARLTREDEDAAVEVDPAVAALQQPFFKPFHQPSAARVVPFREEDEAAVEPKPAMDPASPCQSSRGSHLRARRAGRGLGR